MNQEIANLEEKLFHMKRAQAEEMMANLRTNANATPSAYGDEPGKSTKPQVWCEIDRLQEAAKSLEDMTVRLISKLACVSTPSPPDETRRVNEAVRMQTKSQMADTLGSVTESLYVTTRTIADLCDRMET